MGIIENCQMFPRERLGIGVPNLRSQISGGSTGRQQGGSRTIVADRRVTERGSIMGIGSTPAWLAAWARVLSLALAAFVVVAVAGISAPGPAHASEVRNVPWPATWINPIIGTSVPKNHSPPTPHDFHPRRHTQAAPAASKSKTANEPPTSTAE